MLIFWIEFFTEENLDLELRDCTINAEILFFLTLFPRTDFLQKYLMDIKKIARKSKVVEE